MHKKKRYSLLLVNPKRKYRFHWDLQEVCKIMRRKTAVLPLALPTVAALTPDHYDITIIDEEIEPLKFDNLPDLVGITALVPNIKRAYQIADTFRAKGVKVVMGGPQVSFNVEESLLHADSIIIGEAEHIWQKCLNDFESGHLLPTYQSRSYPEFLTSPIPRWDLVDTRKIMALGVQVSRGCPFRCDFCLVRNMFGRKHRYRDIDDVIREIRSLPKKQITFVDDNLTADKNYSRQLMEKLIPLEISWMCQASIDVARDKELLELMARAGCTSILIGFESVNPDSLRETCKLHNKVQFYEEAINNIHSAGIHVVGSFIIGFESDTLAAFDHVRNFTLKNNLSFVMLNVLSAYPGTDLYLRMKEEGRLSDMDPDLLNGIYPTLRYNNMSQTEMFYKYFDTLEQIFSPEEILKKATELFKTGTFSRFHVGDVSTGDKFFSLLYLAGEYLFCAERSRRRIFMRLIGLAVKGKANIGVIVQYLMFIASFYGYLQFTKEYRGEILEKIREHDRGAILSEAAPAPG